LLGLVIVPLGEDRDLGGERANVAVDRHAGRTIAVGPDHRAGDPARPIEPVGGVPLDDHPGGFVTARPDQRPAGLITKRRRVSTADNVP